MTGYPLNLVFSYRTRKTVGYSQESIVTITSSTIPSGVTVDQSASCRTVVVFLKVPWRLSFNIVSLVMKLMATHKSIRVLGNMTPSMCTYITRLLGSRYFGKITLPNIKSDSCPTTLMVGVSLFLLLGFLKQFSLMTLFYIGTSLMA